MAKPLAKLVSMLKPKRRWAQFSLATLLVVVTVLCVGLSLVVVPAERQRRAVAAIEALGGRVVYDEPDQEESEAFLKPLLRRWLPRDYFGEVVFVWFNGPANDSHLVHLRPFIGLKVLNLDGTQVTDAGLAHLQRLTVLRLLVLDDTQVTNAGMAHLQGLTGLELLSLTNTQVTDAGMMHLHGLAGLQQLYLNNTQVTDAGRAQLQQALPNCRIWP